MIKLILNIDTNINYKGNDGRTALICAIELGQKTSSVMLLAKGANPNLNDPYQRPPLLVAAATNNFEILKLLVDHGADINATTPYGMNALYASISINNREISKFLISKKADMSKTLLMAVKYMDIKAVEFLLNSGAHPDVCDENGINAIKIAQKNRLYEIEDLLLSKGANSEYKRTDK